MTENSEKLLTRSVAAKESELKIRVDKFLVGELEDEISDKQLPTNREVLKYLLYRKYNQMQQSNKKPSLKI